MVPGLLLDRYLAREVALVLLVAAPALGLLGALLQAMRLFPMVAGAEVAPAELAPVGLLLSVLLTGVTLPAAAVLAVTAALSRLEGDGELLAMRAAGAGPARLAAAPAAVGAVVSLVVGAAAIAAEPAAYGALRERLDGLLVRAALGAVRPGVVAEPVADLTVFVRSREGDRFGGLFLEDRRGGPPAQVFAAAARVEIGSGGGEARLLLEDGEVHHLASDGTRTRASFDRLESTLDLAGAGSALGELVPDRLTLGLGELATAARDGGEGAAAAALLRHRRLAAAPAAAGLCLAAVLLALGGHRRGRPLALALASALVLGCHVVARAGEAAVEGGVLGPTAGAWLPAAAPWLVAGTLAAASRARPPRG